MNMPKAPRSEQPNLYVYNTVNGRRDFIATLRRKRTEERELAEILPAPSQIAGEDGQFLLFASSTRSVTPDDKGTAETQLFEYDATNGELVRVTRGEDGYAEDGNAVTKGYSAHLDQSQAGFLGGNGEDFKSTTNQLNIAKTATRCSSKQPAN